MYIWLNYRRPLTALPLDRSVVSRAPRVITNSCALDFAKILLQIGCCGDMRKSRYATKFRREFHLIWIAILFMYVGYPLCISTLRAGVVRDFADRVGLNIEKFCCLFAWMLPWYEKRTLG